VATRGSILPSSARGSPFPETAKLDWGGARRLVDYLYVHPANRTTSTTPVNLLRTSTGRGGVFCSPDYPVPTCAPSWRIGIHRFFEPLTR